MGTGDTKISKLLPTKGLELLESVADAQKRGKPIHIGPERPENEILEPSNVAFVKGKGPQELKSNHVIAIKAAAQTLKKEVHTRSGEATWKVLKHAVPELDDPTARTEAKTLKAAIEKAYGSKSLDAASQIDKALKKPNDLTASPIKAKSFAEYQDALLARGALLAKEFGTSGEIWPLVETLANIQTKIPKEQLNEAQALLEDDIKSYIKENGALPERGEILDMVVERMRYISPESAISLPKFGEDKKVKDFQDQQIKIGIKDFPTAKLRAQVESIVKQSKDNNFQAAMYKVWSDDKLMLNAYEEHLSAQLKEIDKTPTTPDNLREQLDAKLKLFAPGTELFAYLKTFNGHPGLTGESGGEYFRLLSQKLLDEPDSNPAQTAQKAFLGAQKVELARLQHRDPSLVEKVCEPFPDALATQLKKEREINWVHVIDGDQRKGFLAELTGDRLKNKKISEEGFATDFEADAHRATFDFDFGGRGIQRVEGGRTGDAKHLLDLMSKGNETVKATLSKLINQNGIAMPMEGYGSASYNPKMGDGDGPSAIIKESNAMGGRTNFENIYTLRDAPNNKVICEYDFVRAGDQLMINGKTIVPINRDIKMRGDANFENYAERRKVSIELDRKDLEKGIIKPKLITPPTVELHIKPDWGKLAMLNQEGRLNDFSA